MVRLKWLSLGVLFAVLAVSLGVLAQTSSPSDGQLLQAFDDARFLQTTSFTMTVDVVADRPDGTQQATVKLYLKTIDGKDYARIEFLQPQDMVGQVYLSTPDATYFWTPDLVSPLKVSGRQSVYGDATVVETAGIQFVGDYSVASRSDVTLDNGNAGLKVELQATDKSVAYQSATVLADAKTLVPQQVTLYAQSGQPLNLDTFESYADLDGDSYVKEQLIENQLITENKTLLTITDIAAQDFPDSLFDPTQLGQSGS